MRFHNAHVRLVLRCKAGPSCQQIAQWIEIGPDICCSHKEKSLPVMDETKCERCDSSFFFSCSFTHEATTRGRAPADPALIEVSMSYEHSPMLHDWKQRRMLCNERQEVNTKHRPKRDRQCCGTCMICTETGSQRKK